MASAAEKELRALLKASGAVLVRTRKHQVYKLPWGQTFTHASSCSDSAYGLKNAIGDLKRILRERERALCTASPSPVGDSSSTRGSSGKPGSM